MKRIVILFSLLLLVSLMLMAQVPLTGAGTLGALLCSPGPTNLYTTAFPLTENPIAECGSWLNGKVDGISWTDIQTTTNFAKGTQSPTSGLFDDSIATMKGTWNNDQEANGVVVAGTTSDTVQKEIEIHVRGTITANNATEYELQYIGFKTTTANCGTGIIKWNGALGDFTALTTGCTFGITGSDTCLHTGDRIRGTAIGTTLTLYINDKMAKTCTDSTYASGRPGIGTYLQGTGGTNDFGFSSFYATGNPIVVKQSAANQVSTSGTTVAATMATTTSANTLWCTTYWADTARTGSVADVANGSYTAVDSPVNGAGGLSTYRAQTFYKTNITGAATPAITLTLSGLAASIDRAIACHEIQGVTTLDQHPTVKSASGTAMSSNTTGTTTGANEALEGSCVLAGSSPSVVAPWISDQTTNWGGNQTADYVTTGTGTFTFNATQSGSVNYLCALNTFK
jgi:hypothetical protein